MMAYNLTLEYVCLLDGQVSHPYTGTTAFRTSKKYNKKNNHLSLSCPDLLFLVLAFSLFLSLVLGTMSTLLTDLISKWLGS